MGDGLRHRPPFLSDHHHPHSSSPSTAMPRSFDVDDPLAAVLAPPPNESPHDRALREEREAQAKKTSDEIDEMLRIERAALKKRRKPVKVLLLGQSESGKSTTLKSESMSPAFRPCNARQCMSMSQLSPSALPFVYAYRQSHILISFRTNYFPFINGLVGHCFEILLGLDIFSPQ